MLPDKGRVKRVIYPAAKSLPVSLYQPTRVTRTDRVIVAVHGISRQYGLHLDTYIQLAEKFGYWLMVPEFESEHFPRYQQLAKDPVSPRADLALNTVLLVFKGQLGVPELKLHLCGFSGGAQFAHRYALLYPHQLASLVLCSAGWYTFPDGSANYPYGLANWPEWLGENRMKEMLSLPQLIMVGGEDTQRDSSLRCNKKVDRQQGLNRVERAIRWREAMSKKATQLNLPQLQQFFLLPGVGHDFSECIQRSPMLDYIGCFWQEMGDKQYEVA